MNRQDIAGPFSLWDPFLRYSYRCFRVRPGLVVRTFADYAAVYREHVRIEVLTGDALQVACKAINDGQWEEMDELEAQETIDRQNRARYIQDADIAAVRRTKTLHANMTALIDCSGLPTTPQANREKIRAVLRTWRG